MSLDVAAEKSSMVSLPAVLHQKGWPAHPHALIFITGLFFSPCFHTMLTWKLSTLPAASSHSMRMPKNLAHSFHVALVFICKTEALTSFTAVFKVPQPSDTATRRAVSSQALSGLLELTSGENKCWVIFSNTLLLQVPKHSVYVMI